MRCLSAQLFPVLVVEVKVVRDFDVEESSAGASSNVCLGKCSRFNKSPTFLGLLPSV